MKPASSRAGTLVSLGLASLAALVLASAAASRGADGPALDVTFFTDGTISLTLPDGTPVGTTSGAPTVIPAGYYTLLLAGPGGCSELPYFELHGPGENILNDMDLGEMKATATAYFQPNSTYTWRDNGIPGVIYTFTTSSTVVGTPPAPSSGRSSSPASGCASDHVVRGRRRLVDRPVPWHAQRRRHRCGTAVGRLPRQERREAPGRAVHDQRHRPELDGRARAREAAEKDGAGQRRDVRREAIAVGPPDRREVAVSSAARIGPGTRSSCTEPSARS